MEKKRGIKGIAKREKISMKCGLKPPTPRSHSVPAIVQLIATLGYISDLIQITIATTAGICRLHIFSCAGYAFKVSDA